MTLPDVILHFDSMAIIDSLGCKDQATGIDLYKNVVAPASVANPAFESVHLPAPDKASFFQRLADVGAMISRGRYPILHIESHGEREGIRLASLELVTWEEMHQALTPMNRGTQFNLLVVMAMCYGRYLGRAMKLGLPSPVWGVIGPAVSVGEKSLYRGMSAHYASMFAAMGSGADIDGLQALNALNAAQSDPDWEYMLITAEHFFHSRLRRHMQSLQDPVASSGLENEFVASYVAQRDGLIPTAMVARTHFRQRVTDDRYWYDFFRPSFLMLDEFPANSATFKMTFADYLKFGASPPSP